MRGQISDQDLTDYALNELPPEDRLYTESILAISEECRHDVYQMIELAQMIDQGFEAQNAEQAVMLTGVQRATLLDVRRASFGWQKIAAVLVASACVAFTITRTEMREFDSPAQTVAQVSTKAVHVVADAVVPDMVEFTNPFESLRALAEDSSNWLQTSFENEVLTPSPMVCTPPTLFETVQLMPE